MERIEIELEKWSRKIPFNFFNSFDKPFWSITTETDITDLVKFCKDTHTSFYATMSYIIIATCNNIQNFRLRYENGHIYDYSQINGQFTALTQSGNADITRRIHFNRDFDTFIKEFISLKTETEEQRIPPHPKEINDNVVFLSCIPWFKFTQFDPAINYQLKDTVPRITWDKYTLVNDKYFINIAFTIHHAFIDGYHISLFLDEMKNQILRLVSKNKK
ncbi:MAG: CatA-like O-acetyltransferase [Christensenellales bacterium]